MKIKLQEQKVDVDMIPLIDIISLLLMFLIVVGDASISADSVKMRLPRADQALQDPLVNTKGRIVVQLDNINGKYWAVINGRKYELLSGARNATLQEYLEKQVQWSIEKGLATREGLDEAVNIPVKLRIPDQAPMKEVERIVVALSEAHLTHLQYAAMPPDAPAH